MKIVKTIKSKAKGIANKKENFKLAAEVTGEYVLGIISAPILIPIDAYHCIRYGESILHGCVKETAKDLEQREA